MPSRHVTLGGRVFGVSFESEVTRRYEINYRPMKQLVYDNTRGRLLFNVI